MEEEELVDEEELSTSIIAMSQAMLLKIYHSLDDHGVLVVV